MVCKNSLHIIEGTSCKSKICVNRTYTIKYLWIWKDRVRTKEIETWREMNRKRDIEREKERDRERERKRERERDAQKQREKGSQ